MKLSNIFLTSALVVSSLTANDFDTQFNYFGNLTASSLNKDGFNTRGYHVDDVTNHFQLSTYSKLGLQATVYNDDFMFVAQGVTHYEENEVKADLTWLNAKYNLNNNFSIRAGRMQASTFLNSDVRDIDYVNNWGLEPTVIYTMMPMRYYNGIELAYDKVIGDYYININITPYGKVTTDIDDLVDGSTLTIKDIRNISFAISNDDFKFKASYGQINMDIPIYNTDYQTVISTLQAQGNDMSKYSYTDKKVSILTAGFEYNYDNYSFVSEVASRDSDSLLPKTLGYYAQVSYRYDDFIPFIMYGENNNNSSHFNTSYINDPLTGGIAKAGLEQILYQTNGSQKTISIGFRYDLMLGVALKAQIDKITIKNYGADYSAITKRLGYTQRDAGLTDDSVYQTTIGLSFAF